MEKEAINMVEKLIIEDDVHGKIELQGIYKELVESPEFQRLKDIIQTGTSYLEYKNMKNETRFDHSVGSYYLINKIIENIEENLKIHGLEIDKEEIEIAKISMLLHDIGHGAFSHTLEKITGYSHEKRGIDIIKDSNTNINKILVKYHSKEFAQKVGIFIETVYDHKKETKSTSDIKVTGNIVSLKELLASLISNNIDADRLDYLIRDSNKAGYRYLTEVDKLIESFVLVLDVDKLIVAIPEDKKRYPDMAILERARNYKEIYFCKASVIGDNVLEFLLDELRENKQEVPDDIDDTIKRFLTCKNTTFTNKEHLQITQTPINKALKKIANNTKNEKLKELCDIEKIVTDFIGLNTHKDERYIRYLLHKAIPKVSIDTKALVEETRWVKPYKTSESENINIITSTGIEDYGNLPQDFINLKPFSKRVVALSPELLRLELGVTKKEFEEKYSNIIKEIISTVTKPRDEFELRYVMYKENIKEIVEEKYKITNYAKYLSCDKYYDNPENLELLKSKKTLRIREGTTFYKSQETYKFKKRRITYKTYKKDIKSGFTICRKDEEIGEGVQIQDYTEFLKSNKIKIDKIEHVLTVNNIRHLYTVDIKGSLIDVSYNTAKYENQINKSVGTVDSIEIRPRDNSVSNRLALLELREFLENKIPQIKKYVSNSNVYEVGMNL